MKLDLLCVLGVGALAGLALGWVVKKLRSPRVVGYIIAGVILGDSLLSAIPLNLVSDLAPFTDFALALIGFTIGGELKGSVFAKFGRQLVVIMLAEGISATILVTGLITAFTGDLPLALLLGALASATAPAATVDVLWEYEARGPLTTTILGIVALDDALALVLYGFAAALARSLLEGKSLSMDVALVEPTLHIAGSLGIGFVVGWILTIFVRRVRRTDDLLVLLLGAVLLVAGLTRTFELSVILAEMALGTTLVNMAPNASRQAFAVAKSFTPPIYVLFFVLVGARLQVWLLPTMGLVGLLYVAGRTAGKMGGAWLGSTAMRAPDAVRKYLGFALFSQAGVAVGLALAIAQEYRKASPEAQEVGTLVVNVIAATTFIVQIIGPPFVKFSISRAKEMYAGGEEEAHADVEG